jgi:hypothetical protein
MNTFENTRTAAQFFQGSLAYRLEQVAGKVTIDGELDKDTLTDLRSLAEVLNQFNALMRTVAVADAIGSDN